MIRNSVRASRASKGMSQSDLAQKIDATRQTVAAIEKGDYSPSALLALRIAYALEIPFNELFWLEEEK
ncbi:helix-turn-helix transcriptional regulator [Candidatus Saccharibacteria bacterium]|nr:helix-turn-helix transcriptional regulator [Candidatus Saccharibacteria bacterium]